VAAPSLRSPCRDRHLAITFGEYAPDWLQRKVDGELGDRPLSENTENDHRWRLLHLTPFFATYPLDEIDAELCLAFKAAKLREARELRQAIEAGADIRDTRNRRVQPLGPSSIRKLIDTLATILDDAIEDDHLEHNGARSKRMRVRVPKKRQTFLEMDSARAEPASAAPEHVAAHASPHVYLDRAAGEQLRREVGHGTGGACRLQDDDGRIRAVGAASEARPRSELLVPKWSP